MQEYTTPGNITIPADANLTDALWVNEKEKPNGVAFRRRSANGWDDITAGQFAAEVRAVAAGLVASGVKQGDRVALMSKTRYEWTLCDYAIWAAGGVTVPIYETSSAEQVEWIIGDSGAVAAIVESDLHEKTVESVRGQLPDLVNVWQIDNLGVDALKGAGSKVKPAELDKRQQALKSDTLATIIYTSGTTGRPKGCELTHGNLMYDVQASTANMKELFNEDGSTLLFLPLAHVFARLIQVGCVTERAVMGHTADIKNLLPDLATFQPTFLLSVPRVFEKVYNASKQKAHADGKGKLFDRAETVAIAYSEGLGRGSVPIQTKLEHAVWDKLVYSKLRAAMGGRVRHAVSGGAPLGARLGHFFRGIGVNIFEGYGLTETSAGSTINLPGVQKIGTVGRPLPGTSVKIAEDGEILLKGAHIFRGYWHNPKATKEAIEAEGWFHTGDIGEIDANGFLKITGRKKELIVTAGGKNVAPAVLEDRLRAHPLVSQCLVVGDNQPFIGCLVTIDPEAFPAWRDAHGKPAGASVADLVDDADLRGVIQEAINETNKAVSKAEAIKSFRILPVDFTEDGGQLTPTLKVKRNVVMKDFAKDIDAIYTK